MPGGRGYLGAGLAMLASLPLLSGELGVVTPAYLAMNAPLALQTLVFAVWLIARGFDTRSLRPKATVRALTWASATRSVPASNKHPSGLVGPPTPWGQ